MVYGCGNKCVKYSVLVVNLLVCIAGAAILAVSLALALSSNFTNDFSDLIKKGGLTISGSTLDDMKVVFYVTAGIGGLIFLTGFLGCCGAGCENTCLLGLFFVIVLILFLAELAVGIAALVLQGQGKLEGKVDDFYTNNVIKNLNGCNDPTNALLKAWTQIQNETHCCGCHNVTDYKSSPNCARYCQKQYENQGCCSLIWKDVQNNLIAVGGVSIGLLVIELLAMIFSCCLCSAIKNKYRNYS